LQVFHEHGDPVSRPWPLSQFIETFFVEIDNDGNIRCGRFVVSPQVLIVDFQFQQLEQLRLVDKKGCHHERDRNPGPKQDQLVFFESFFQ